MNSMTPNAPFRHSVFLICGQRLMRESLAALIHTQPDLELAGQAGNEAEAESLLRNCAPQVIVWVADEQPELIQQFKPDAPQARVLAVLPEKGAALLRGVLQAGASGCLPASATGETFFQAIRGLAAGGVYLDDQLMDTLLSITPLPKSTQDPRNHQELTAREEEVLRLVAHGYKSREIAGRLHIALQTVSVHCARAKRRLNLHSRAEIVAYGLQHGWLEHESADYENSRNQNALSIERPRSTGRRLDSGLRIAG